MPSAFPGAYGWGAAATGGRGGTIKVVSSLANSGAGTLRAALEASGARIIVFSIAGEIDLPQPITVTNGDFTIAGQTAPGNGVYITGERITLQAGNAIIRYLKYRGDGGVGFLGIRAESGDVQNVIIDHCSMAWNSDDALDVWHEGDIAEAGYLDNELSYITIQNCLFTEPDNGHPTTSFYRGDYNNNAELLVHHISHINNLHTNTGYRNPYIFSQHSEVVNNVIYNFGWYPMGFGDEVEVDVVNNYLDVGTINGGGQEKFARDNEYGDNQMSVYINGNVFEGTKAAGDDDWPYVNNEFAPGGNPTEGTHRRLTRLSQPTYPAPLLTAAAAYEQVLKSAGARHRLNNTGSRIDNQDTLDARIESEVRNDTGPSSYITDPSSETPPTVISGTALTDTDGDGMPDDYEDNAGLDKADDTDGPTIAANGYSNVENFLNNSLYYSVGGPRGL